MRHRIGVAIHHPLAEQQAPRQKVRHRVRRESCASCTFLDGLPAAWRSGLPEPKSLPREFCHGVYATTAVAGQTNRRTRLHQSDLLRGLAGVTFNDLFAT